MFNAYTNQTRFAWTYASSTLDGDLCVPQAMTGLLDLNLFNIVDHVCISEQEYCDANSNLIYKWCLLLLYGLNSTNPMDAPVDGKED